MVVEVKNKMLKQQYELAFFMVLILFSTMDNADELMPVWYAAQENNAK